MIDYTTSGKYRRSLSIGFMTVFEVYYNYLYTYRTDKSVEGSLHAVRRFSACFKELISQFVCKILRKLKIKT